MARPMKEGLDYFPLDVDFFADTEIRILRANFGADGVALYIYILCEIYRRGYYVKADEDFISLAALDLGQSVEKTRLIISFFCKRSLFDKKLFAADTVLTARSVQRRYQEIRRQSKRTVSVDEKLWLLGSDETSEFIKLCPCDDISGKNRNFSGKNRDKSAKNSTKEKESKEKQRKEEGRGADAPSSDAASPHPLSENNSASSVSEGKSGEKPDVRSALAEKYGADKVTLYEEKYRCWCAKKGIPPSKSGYSVIAEWLEQDCSAAEKSPPYSGNGGCFAAETASSSSSSFTVEDLIDNIRSFYNRGHD